MWRSCAAKKIPTRILNLDGMNSMKKNLLASAVCLAIATSPITHTMAATGGSPAGSAPAASQVSPVVESMAKDVSVAAKQSPEALQQMLNMKVQTVEQARTLNAALQHLSEQQLIDQASVNIIRAHVSEFGVPATAAASTKAAGGIFSSTLVQAGLVVAGVGGIAAAASGGGGGGGGSSAPAAAPVVVTPPVTVEPTPTEPTPVEPTPTEPTPVKPTPVEPTPTEPTPVEPTPVEPTPVEPTPTEPTPVEPTPVEPTPTEPAEPTPVPQKSKPTQAEYTFSRMGAGIQAAHANSFTGSNAVVAILDTGFASDHIELAGQFDGFYNAYTGSELAADAIDVDGHGTHVAGIIGAKANNYMGVGYAPDASLLGVRIGDQDGELMTTTQQTADAFHWARMKGADFINNSWGPKVYASEFTADQISQYVAPEINEFRVGAQAGVIYVWANGNEGTSQPGLYAALPQLFPELQANWVAVANVDSATGELHASSQACGDARDWCISAPGTDIAAPFNAGSDSYAVLTGTSMAAPAVTGALAVLKDTFPMLTNEQIVDRLFFTADKTGVYANMALYGQGLMDIGAATSPVGPLSVVNGSGTGTQLAITTLRMGSAFGTSNPLQGVKVMALDAQGAGFITDLGGVVQNEEYEFDLEKSSARLAQQAPREVNGGHGMTLTFSHNGADMGQMDNMVMGFAGNDGSVTRFGMVSNVDVLAGGVNFAGLSQQSVSFAAPYWMSENDTTAVGFKQGVGFLGGNFAVTAMNSAERTGMAASYSYNLTRGYISTLELGLVNGSDSLFGSETNGALSFGDKSETRFVGMRGEYKRDELTLFHSAYMGQSDVSASGLFSGLDTVVTSSWTLGGKYDLANKQFGLLVAQPLKAESANANLSFISGYQNGAFTTDTVNVDLAPTGRQINTELYFATSTRAIDDIKLSFMRMEQPGHNAYAKAEHVATLSMGTRF